MLLATFYETDLTKLDEVNGATITFSSRRTETPVVPVTVTGGSTAVYSSPGGESVGSHHPTGCLLLDGVDAYVTSSTAIKMPSGGDFTIEAWVRPLPRGAGPVMVGTGHIETIVSWGSGITAQINATDAVNASNATFASNTTNASNATAAKDATNRTAAAPPTDHNTLALVDGYLTSGVCCTAGAFSEKVESANHVGNRVGWGVWHHVAATQDGTTRRLYVDGELVKQEEMAAPAPTPMQIDIGGKADSAGLLYGSVAHVRVWNLARTRSQLLGTMQSALVESSDQNGLVGEWPMVRQRLRLFEGKKVNDTSGMGNHATLANGAVFGSACPLSSGGVSSVAVIGRKQMEFPINGTGAFELHRASTSIVGQSGLTIDTWARFPNDEGNFTEALDHVIVSALHEHSGGAVVGGGVELKVVSVHDTANEFSCVENGQTNNVAFGGLGLVGTKVFFAPWGADHVSVLDVPTGVITKIPHHIPGNWKWWGEAAVVGTKVYFAPWKNVPILVINSADNQISFINHTLNDGDSTGYFRGATAYGNKVYFAPSTRQTIGVTTQGSPS